MHPDPSLDESRPVKRPVRPAGAAPSRFWIWLVPLILGLLVAAVAVGLNDYERARVNGSDAAVLAAQHFVRDKFGADISLRYPGREWIKTEVHGDEYTVRGWVEATSNVNVALESSTYEFVCVVSQDPDGSWFTTRLDLVPQ